jgi:hypothetical protein
VEEKCILGFVRRPESKTAWKTTERAEDINLVLMEYYYRAIWINAAVVSTSGAI